MSEHRIKGRTREQMLAIFPSHFSGDPLFLALLDSAFSAEAPAICYCNKGWICGHGIGQGGEGTVADAHAARMVPLLARVQRLEEALREIVGYPYGNLEEVRAIARAALAAPDTAGGGRTDTCWLIERAGPRWLCGPRAWTARAHEATRYRTKADAEREIASEALFGKFGAIATEHGFFTAAEVSAARTEAEGRDLDNYPKDARHRETTEKPEPPK